MFLVMKGGGGACFGILILVNISSIPHLVY